MTSRTESDALSQIEAEFVQLRTDYAGEDVRGWEVSVAQQMGLKNPATGKPYSADEAYRLLTGKAATTAAELAAKELQLKAGAKAGMAGHTGQAPAAVAPGNVGLLSEADGVAEANRLLKEGH